jgi:hypothetical protein
MSTSVQTANADLDRDYGSAYPNANIYACLTTAAPDLAAGTIVQPTTLQYDTYAEVVIPNDVTHWPPASGGVKHHAVDFTFPTPGSGSGSNIPLTHIVFRTDSTVNGGGRILDALPLPTGSAINPGQPQFFPAGSISITES